MSVGAHGLTKDRSEPWGGLADAPDDGIPIIHFFGQALRYYQNIRAMQNLARTEEFMSGYGIPEAARQMMPSNDLLLNLTHT